MQEQEAQQKRSVERDGPAMGQNPHAVQQGKVQNVKPSKPQ